jgi:hypothetical protein
MQKLNHGEDQECGFIITSVFAQLYASFEEMPFFQNTDQCQGEVLSTQQFHLY